VDLHQSSTTPSFFTDMTIDVSSSEDRRPSLSTHPGLSASPVDRTSPSTATLHPGASLLPPDTQSASERDQPSSATPSVRSPPMLQPADRPSTKQDNPSYSPNSSHTTQLPMSHSLAPSLKPRLPRAESFQTPSSAPPRPPPVRAAYSNYVARHEHDHHDGQGQDRDRLIGLGLASSAAMFRNGSGEQDGDDKEELTTKGRKRKRLAKACSACHVSDIWY
jgi:hypothetical protein